MSSITENIFEVDIVEEMEQCFLDYSLSVITHRALPDVRDGLKPVHKRILYAMHDMGLTSSKGYKKSARVVGDVIGKYHPHGDFSVYEAMVRMAQDFSMRYPLVDGQGNFGTVDGDPAAAMRYTEARMSKIANEMLRDIKKETVDFQLNFSEDEHEPIVLPGRIPNLLLNGTTGIAVGMACSFPSHHLGSTLDMISHYIKSDNTTIEELYDILQGPDFATGGIIINKNELLDGYKTGRGRVRLRGKYHVEKNGKTRENVVFTEIPYAVNKEKLIEDIARLCESKDIEGIADLRDESDRNGIRLVIELKKDINPDVMANILFSKTQLENTFSMNFTCLVDGEPRVLNLKEIVKYYVRHQQDVIRRRSQFDYDRICSRIEILDGYLKALTDIDNIIKTIKQSPNSSSAQESLMAQYGFSPRQAKAILEMKLSKLTGLEKVEIENELKELMEEMSYLGEILSNIEKLNDVLLEEILEIKNAYNDNRRTEITYVAVNKEEKDIQFVQPEEVVVVMTRNGNIKKIPSKSFRIQNTNTKGIKNYDETIMDVIRTNTIDTLMFFTNFGKVYRLLVDDVPTGTNASRGVGVGTLVKLEQGEQVLAFTSLYRKTKAEFAVFTTTKGLIKKSRLSEYISSKRSAAGIQAIKLREDDNLSGVTFISGEQMLILTKLGKSIRFATDSITPVGRTALGVVAIKLDENDEVVSALPINKDTDNLAIFTENGLGKQTSLKDYPLQGRGGKGTIAYRPTNNTGLVVSGALVDDNDNILIVGDQTTLCVSTKNIPTLSKAALGNIMIKENKILGITKL